MPSESTPFMHQLRHALRAAGYTAATRRAYISWICRFLAFCEWRAPQAATPEDAAAFLRYLQRRERVAAATLGQARAALRFLFHSLLRRSLPLPRGPAVRRRPQAPLAPATVAALLAELDMPYDLLAGLLYRTGLPVGECLRLRVGHLDVARGEIHGHDATGRCRHRVNLPPELQQPVRVQLDVVKARHERDRAAGRGYATPPDGLHPGTAAPWRGWEQQFLFPSPRLAYEPTWERLVRHHLHPTTLHKQLRAAARAAEVGPEVTAQALRQAGAVQRMGQGTAADVVEAQRGRRQPIAPQAR
jgi:integrase